MNLDTARRAERVAHGSSDDTEMLDFSANTNPATPEGVAEVYREALDLSRRYPAEPPNRYCGAAAEYVDCAPEQVIPMPGGLAAIRRTVALAVENADSVLVPFPSFGEYEREVRLQGGDPSFVPQGSILDVDPSGHALVIVCNPNNPTGNACDVDALEAFAARCRTAGTPLLVDEAFLGFTDQPSLAGTDGVIVARSLTKLFGLPGIRAGFAVATGPFREGLASARRPWNVSEPALATGSYCMTRTDFVARTRERVRSERARMRRELAPRFDIRPSEAPFLLLDVGDRDVGDLLEYASEQSITLRDATTFRGLDNHVRVAVRAPGENTRLLEALRDV
jgi:histidinol-phosphate/aromatic aminotransferase/cobyric acid decarboxylase-like protein